MAVDGRQIEDLLRVFEDVWSKVRPGTRVCGSNEEGDPCVFMCEDLTKVGIFDSEAEAEAFALAPQHIDKLISITKKLLKERDEARKALKEIRGVTDPAFEAFNEQKPVDMATVLKTTHHWSHYILSQ